MLFILKETNDYRGDFRILVRESPWRMLGYWAYGLQYTQRGIIPLFQEAKINYQESCRSAAIMNLKKLTGAGSSNFIEIQNAARVDKYQLCKALEIIAPEIVVCCGTFELAKEVLIPTNDYTMYSEDDNWYKFGEMIWLRYCHPSAPYQHSMMYYGLVGMFHGYLQHNADQKNYIADNAK